MYKVVVMVAVGCSAVAGALMAKEDGGKVPVVMERIVVDRIWSAVSVGFCLVTHGEMQYVAYYDSNRDMAVAQRKLSGKVFSKAVLPSKQTWDSHNYITMAVDSAGHIHLSGNMHAGPLVYFCTERAGDITTLKRIVSMVGSNERRCTYPKFMAAPDGSLLYHYRDGGSGNGVEIYNVYDAASGAWRRFLETPLISGQGRANAYQRGPLPGPDGWYHLIWMWRDTPDVATNHDLSYARSRDLKRWESAAGKPMELPMTMAQRAAIIDPVPVNGGLHNSNHHLGFDSRGRVVVSYFKHDPEGNTQAYVAHHEGESWQIRQVSGWEGRHLFKGGGSGPSTFGTSLSVGGVSCHGDGRLALPFSHWKAGSGLLILDEETLDPVGLEKKPLRYPRELMAVTSDFPGMRVSWRDDTGEATGETGRYVLRWETLGSNRDRPRPEPWPEPSELVLYRLGE